MDDLLVHKAMSLLCKRVGKHVINQYHWCNTILMQSPYTNGKNYYIHCCLFCDEHIPSPDGPASAIRTNHAIKHLKEHNLLAFL